MPKLPKHFLIAQFRGPGNIPAYSPYRSGNSAVQAQYLRQKSFNKWIILLFCGGHIFQAIIYW